MSLSSHLRLQLNTASHQLRGIDSKNGGMEILEVFIGETIYKLN